MQTQFSEQQIVEAVKIAISTLLNKSPETPKRFPDLQTIEDIIVYKGANPADYEIMPTMTARQRMHIRLERLMLLEVFNEEWVSDMSDANQAKYYPWFDITPDASAPAGFRLSFCDYVCDLSNSGLGARPLFRDVALAKKMGVQFESEYTAWAQDMQLARRIRNAIMK